MISSHDVRDKTEVFDNAADTLRNKAGQIGAEDRSEFISLFSMQSEYLDRMSSLFDDSAEEPSQAAERLLAARQHRDQIRLVNSLSAHHRGHGERGLGCWRPGRHDTDNVHHHNPLGLVEGHGLQAFKSPLHGLIEGGVALISLISPPHTLTTQDMLKRFYTHHKMPGASDSEDSAAIVDNLLRDTIRYLGTIIEDADSATLAKRPYTEITAPDCGQRLAVMLQAIATARNVGIDPYSTHPHFYCIAGETVCADIDLTHLDAHFALLAKLRYPDLVDILVE